LGKGIKPLPSEGEVGCGMPFDKLRANGYMSKLFMLNDKVELTPGGF